MKLSKNGGKKQIKMPFQSGVKALCPEKEEGSAVAKEREKKER